MVACQVHFDAGKIAEDAFDEGVGEELVGRAAAALLDAEGAVILDAVVAGGDGLTTPWMVRFSCGEAWSPS